MNIALIGYGKMGKTIESLAAKKGHNIFFRADSKTSFSASELAGADVAIEFSRPEKALQNVILCMSADVPVICGTTGWQESMQEAEKFCRENNKSFFYSANFSIGVNIFFEINKTLARLMNVQQQYDEILIHETHHTEKLDAPSGTAIVLAKQIISEVQRLKQWVNYRADENINLGADVEGELPVFSTRENDIPGTHIVKYFSDVDEIEIIHKALSRQGFAMGALAAAEWIVGKKGVFSMKDLLKL